MALALVAPAKVNLFLRVCGRRADGYHELETLFHAIDLCDDVVAERIDRPAVELEVVGSSGTGLPIAAGDDNLVVRAARAFLAAADLRESGLRVRLTKRIPAGGGLGGGSSDAAATLRLANALFEHPLADEALHQLAAPLGADVPFFLHGGTQIGRGTGTDLTRFPAVALSFVLIFPAFGTSTVRVYENYRPQLHDGAETTTIEELEAQFSQGISLAAMVRNDLEGAAARAYPELARLRSRIAAEGFPSVRVSGSGSTMFLAFERDAEAERASAALQAIAGSVAGAELMVVSRARSAPHVRPEHVPWPGGRNP